MHALRFLITGGDQLKTVNTNTYTQTCSDGSRAPPPVMLDRSAEFPNAIMTIFHAPRRVGISAHVHLHKSLTSATAFGVILKTPLFIPQRRCTGRYCEKLLPDFRRADTLDSMRLSKGAHLLDDQVFCNVIWTTDIRLHDFRFAKPFFESQNAYGQAYAWTNGSTNMQLYDLADVNTILALLRLVDRPRTPDSEHLSSSNHVCHSCRLLNGREYWDTSYHMELYMTIETLLDFRDKVRNSD